MLCAGEDIEQTPSMDGDICLINPSAGLIFSFLALCLSFASIFMGILDLLFHYILVKEKF